MESDEQSAAPTPDPEPKAPALPPFNRRDPKARRKLLERLPTLAYQNWSIRENLSFDEDWSDVANLRVDSILEPLERLASDPHRRKS